MSIIESDKKNGIYTKGTETDMILFIIVLFGSVQFDLSEFDAHVSSTRAHIAKWAYRCLSECMRLIMLLFCQFHFFTPNLLAFFPRIRFFAFLIVDIAKYSRKFPVHPRCKSQYDKKSFKLNQCLILDSTWIPITNWKIDKPTNVLEQFNVILIRWHFFASSF